MKLAALSNSPEYFRAAMDKLHRVLYSDNTLRMAIPAIPVPPIIKTFFCRIILYFLSYIEPTNKVIRSNAKTKRTRLHLPEKSRR